MTVTADDLDSALAVLTGTLEPATDRDRSARAGTLEWDCRHPAEHTGDVLMSYAAHLVARPATHYVRPGGRWRADQGRAPRRNWSMAVLTRPGRSSGLTMSPLISTAMPCAVA